MRLVALVLMAFYVAESSAQIQACKRPDGPTGNGKVKVTFGPNGQVNNSEIEGPPFAGTAVGGCIAGKFRAAHVPPFSGAPVAVGKSFSLE